MLTPGESRRDSDVKTLFIRHCGSHTCSILGRQRMRDCEISLRIHRWDEPCKWIVFTNFMDHPLIHAHPIKPLKIHWNPVKSPHQKQLSSAKGLGLGRGAWTLEVSPVSLERSDPRDERELHGAGGFAQWCNYLDLREFNNNYIWGWTWRGCET